MTFCITNPHWNAQHEGTFAQQRLCSLTSTCLSITRRQHVFTYSQKQHWVKIKKHCAAPSDAAKNNVTRMFTQCENSLIYQGQGGRTIPEQPLKTRQQHTINTVHSSTRSQNTVAFHTPPRFAQVTKFGEIWGNVNSVLLFSQKTATKVVQKLPKIMSKGH